MINIIEWCLKRGNGSRIETCKSWCCLNIFAKKVCFLTMQRVSSMLFSEWTGQWPSTWFIIYMIFLQKHVGFGPNVLFPSRLFILGAIMSLWFLHISHCSTAAFKQLSIALTFRPVFQCDCKVPWCNFLIRWFLLFREKGLNLGFCW